jgi:hypothetical protein
MLPSVAITKTDGNLGVSANTERILAIIGDSTSGDTNVATSCLNSVDAKDEFGTGRLVEAASYALGQGVPCVLVRAVSTTAGDYGTIDDAGVAGTATVAEGATEPDGTYDVVVEILTGGALGTAGIIFRYSLDGGVSWSADQALGTSLTMTLSHGVSFALDAAASTLVAGDTWSVTTSAPKVLTADLTAALAALKDYAGEWLRVLVLAEADATIIGQLNTWAESFHVDGKYPEIITNTRPRDLASPESRATYQTALAAIAAAQASSEIMCCADQCEMVSLDGWRIRLPVSISAAVRTMVIDDSQYPEARSLPALPGVFLTTAAGAADYHDEARHGGLDSLGFTVLRTFRGRPLTPGVFVCNSRTMAGLVSDFRYFPRSAILNRIIESAFSLLGPKLNMSVLLNENGTIREDVAAGIEDAVEAELRTIYADPGRVSGVQFALSRTDNVLTTDTITFDVAAQPTGVAKKFIGKAGLVRVLRNT